VLVLENQPQTENELIPKPHNNNKLYGKLFDNLGLSNLTRKMKTCVVFAVLLLIFITVSSIFRFWTGFPSAWDMRGFALMFFVIFFVAVWDKRKK
jgi:hypothetical protein